MPSQVSSDWSGGIFTLTVNHNGPVDIQINCSGTAEGRKVTYTEATITAPEKPSFYTGARQYEAEFFDYKNIGENVKQGAKKGILNYTGQGYMKFGTASNASVRDNVYTEKSGSFILKLKYAVTEGEINSLDLFVNGEKVASPVLSRTADLNTWAIFEQEINLSQGDNTIELTANDTLAGVLYVDNFTVEGDFGVVAP
ncbi:hypothetical protein D3C75_801700 [compost metagenome]